MDQIAKVLCICNWNRNTSLHLKDTVRKTEMQPPHTPHSTQRHAQPAQF